MRFLIAALLLTLFASQAEARTIYVNNVAGSNTNTGTIDENQGDGFGPLRTISAALQLARRGDRIELANTGAYYEECITLQGAKHSGYEYAPFIIDGNGATLDGTAVVPPHKWEVVREGLFRYEPQRGGYQQLFLGGSLAEQLPRFDGRYAGLSLKPKQWCRCNGGINFAVEEGKSPNSYDLRYAKHRVGITLYDVQRVVIRDLNVQGFQLDGINAFDNAWDCVLSNVTSTGNGRSGVSVGGSSRVTIGDSDFYDNSDVQLNADNWSTTKLIRTRMVAEDAPVWKRWTNDHGRGARVYVDGELQKEVSGWMTKEDLEQQELEQGLEQLEKEDAESGDVEEVPDQQPAEADDAMEAANDEEEVVSPIEDAADEGDMQEEAPAEDEDPFGDNPFGGEGGDAGEDDPFGDEDDPFGDI